MNFKQLAFFAFLIILSATSCKKEVEGCTDTAADNYNPDANESGGECFYQKRFAGEYNGIFNCEGTFKGIFDEATMTISEFAEKNKVNVIIETKIGPLPVEGIIINSDTISINKIFPDLSIIPEDLFPGTGTTPISAKGHIITKLGISSDNKTLSGKLNLTLENNEPLFVFPAGTKFPDTCDFTATKK